MIYNMEIGCELYLETSVIPVTNEKIEFGFWFRKWYLDDRPVIDTNWTKSSSSFLEVERGKVGKSANLILELEHITPVFTWQNGAVCA